MSGPTSHQIVALATARRRDFDAIAKKAAYMPVWWAPFYYIDSKGQLYSGIRRRLEQGLRKIRHVINDGYPQYTLLVDGKICRRKAHILVLEAFRGRRPTGMVSRHLNGVRTDCRLSNLAWGTQTQNIADAREHGTLRGGNVGCPGVINGSAKLSENDVRAIRGRLRQGLTLRAIAGEFGVTPRTIVCIRDGLNWTHVLEEAPTGSATHRRTA